MAKLTASKCLYNWKRLVKRCHNNLTLLENIISYKSYIMANIKLTTMQATRGIHMLRVKASSPKGQLI